MTNPEIIKGKTPNGGDYSEMWYFDKDGEAAESMETAVHFRIFEKNSKGETIQTTYGLLEKE